MFWYFLLDIRYILFGFLLGKYSLRIAGLSRKKGTCFLPKPLEMHFSLTIVDGQLFPGK